jgi:uncharacterized protein YwgA
VAGNKPMMRPRDLVLTVIGKCSSRPEFGRTSLQKVTYFVSLYLNVDFGYGAYYYGPYSASVEADAEALAMSGLISETVEPLGFSNRGGYPANRFRYAITSEGSDRLVKVGAAYPDLLADIQSFIDRIISVAGSLDQATLAAAAKTLYIAREQNKALDIDKIKDLGSDFGWDLTKPMIMRVANILKDLNFVRVS